MNREDQIARLKSESFEMLVIGGGATGTGVALDAASRRINVALVERDDFASGTSSRSTKLIHGGVRYLEQAVKRFDRSQFNLVRDALHERATLINIAPHLAKPLPLVTPIYNPLQVPYFTTGLKLYDALAGKSNLASSRFVDAKEAIDRFPMLKHEGLSGAVIYYDGQFDDARMNVTIALTAAQEGAAIANHVETIALRKNTDGQLCGATVRDTLTGDTWDIDAQVVVNATGPFTDQIRHLDDPDAVPMLRVSSGVHLVLGKQFSPPATGLLIPETEDGRVLFLLPWLDYTLVGTTDGVGELSDNPKASEEEIEYILRHIRKYFAVPASQDDILSSWAGLRPLVSDPKASDTAKLSRDHVINISDSGLLTIAGGKWTTYRKMALDAVNTAIAHANISVDRGSQTETLKLIGAKNYCPTGGSTLQTDYGLDFEVAHYLNRAYGDRASQVAALAQADQAQRLAPAHPYLEAEVRYAVRQEAARSAIDVLARRTRLSFLDLQAARQAIPRTVAILQEELGWDAAQCQRDREAAIAYFHTETAPAAPTPVTTAVS